MKGVRYFLLGLVLVAATAMGQMPPGFKMPTLKYNPALLMAPAVQKDMNISPDTAAKIQNALMQEAMKMMPAISQAMSGKKMSQKDQVKMGTQMLAAYEEMEKATLVYLNPQQKVRLHQITLQSFGPKALADPKVGEEIGLTPQQQTTIAAKFAALNAENAKAMKGLFDPSKGFDPSKAQEFAAAQKASQAKMSVQAKVIMNSVLTNKQKIAWMKLQGRPMDMSQLGPMTGMFGG